MPGLVRKLLIFATVEALVLQVHGPAEHHRAIGIDFKTKQIKEYSRAALESSVKAVRLESYGIIGQISVASSSFLIAITRREQVAQVFGKPIFVVTNVALLPLSSKDDADQAILAATSQNVPTSEGSDSEFSDFDSEDEQTTVRGTEVSSSPSEYESPFKQPNSSSTSVAEDVARRSLNFGRFASHWLVKRGSVSTENQRPGMGLPKVNSGSLTSNTTQERVIAQMVAQPDEDKQKSVAAEKESNADLEEINSSTSLGLLPKIIRSTKMILNSRSYFFSYDVDLTRRLGLQDGQEHQIQIRSLNPLYFWNRHMTSQFIDTGHEAFVLPIVQGFVGQRKFALRYQGSRRASAIQVESHSSDFQDAINDPSATSEKHTFLLTLISRRSIKRSGLRYLRRGIDDDGNCANFVETEQILSPPDWRAKECIRSFVQVRGSIPLYFSQSPYAFKPAAILHNSAQANESAFKKHFQDLQRQYGKVEIAMLVDKHGPELSIGNAYERLYNQGKSDGQLNEVDFEWFDFHMECRGMKFENVQRLVTKMQNHLDTCGETVVQNGTVQSIQKGLIRTNCMDCLDRTNVAQSAFAQYRLQKDLRDDGYDIDLINDESTNWFNTLWADNGDAISRLYAGSAAMKGDYTRTRKRDWKGAINDLGIVLTRYYGNIVNDYFSQAVIDLLLGNASWRIFEDFESTMVSADPGISVQSAREAAVESCAKIVIQDSKEDLIHGWTMLAPAQENTLRTLPFEEVIVLLTNAAIYCCKLDWSTEKVARFEKVDLRSISNIRYGTYVTSTFTEKQLDESLNQGILITFTPGKEDLIRVNTRSLQNVVDSDQHTTSNIDGGTGILSWLARGPSQSQERMLALKIIPTPADSGRSVGAKGRSPHDMSESISEEIQRAASDSNNPKTRLVEAGDIISAAEAKKRTGYLEQLGHLVKRFVWA